MFEHYRVYPTYRPHHKSNTLCTAISLAILALSAGSTQAQPAQAAQSEVEEVIVTGSYIRRSEGLNAASPITQLTAEDLEAEGTVNMAQIVQNLTFNIGTGVSNSIQGTTNQIAAFNLRGLGTSATLELIDGKRVPTDNVQRMMPTIAIQRMDIVTDGAAALYGSDAVAGVVNMVPYTSYDGFKLEYYEEGDSEGDFREIQTSFIAGKSFNDVDIVVAGSYRDGGQLRWNERPDLARAGLTHNSGANPANWNVPRRDASGQLTGASASLPEPSCGSVVDDQMSTGNNPFGVLALGRCWLSFGDTRDFIEAMDVGSLYGNLNWDVSSDLTLSAQLLWSRQIVRGRENAGNPGARVAELPIVRGELPGNPFRAMTSTGQELFAEPARDGAGNIVLDGLGRPLPLRGSDGQVVLAANQLAPMGTDPLGGVPFYEDVIFGAWLPFGKLGGNTLPSSFGSDGTNREDDDQRALRMAFTADFTVPYISGWEGTAFYVYGSDNNQDLMNQNFSFSAVEQGLSCDVVNQVESCFNPFGAVDPDLRNSQEVANSVAPRNRRDDFNRIQTLDVIFNGTIPTGRFSLPGGEIGAAIGYQRRDEEIDDDPALSNQLNDQLIGSRLLPQKEDRFVNAWFAEILLPILDNLEFSAAVRDEDFSTGQGDTVNKFGIVYRPTDWLQLRATVGEAFVAPTLTQITRQETCGLSNVNDPFTPFSGFVTSCIGGNPDLQSETSDSTSIGFDLTLIDGLTITANWSKTEFDDRIVSTTTEDIIRSDFRKFQEYSGFVPTATNPFPSVALLQQWVNNPLSDRRVIRSPTDITTVARINQSDSNASSMDVEAFDLQIGYTRDIGRFGSIRANLTGTFVDVYDFRLSEFDPERDAVGKQNNPFGAVPAIPEIMANLRLGWSLGRHTVNATVRYVDEVDFDANEFSFQRFFPDNNFRSNANGEISAWTQLDMFYTYQGLNLAGLGELTFTLGSRNLTDRQAQKTGQTSGLEAQLQSSLGRVIYARASFDF
ncbi:MAG: TonB-dependent receptor [Pseudomonadales bacterium]|nr:TonB-dependent receptor [Pseudomonadales bacterium]